jgi:PAS domain S-box-containing protein
MLGYRIGELVGRDVIATLHPTRPDGASASAEETAIFAALENAQRSATDAMFYRKDGSSFPVQYIGAPIRGESGVVGAVITFQDVTQRREIERMKNEFVSVVSHELRTPLTSIRGALGLLASGKMGNFPEKPQRMLDIAVNNTDRLVRLINDILDIERIDSGRTAMQKRELDIADLMHQAIDVMRAMAEKNSVTLEAIPVRCRIEVDSDRIIQTFTNLLSNAIKFSPAGSVVSIGGKLDGTRLHVYVKDQGRGIPQDKIESIFERFHQVDASDSREKGGTGLGLAICRTIVQQHGGQIWAESTVGEGSTFHIELPLVAAAPPQFEQKTDGARVLVCDDDPAVLEVVGTMLHARGFRVTAVANGEDVIKVAATDLPDLVIMDLVMPSISGWQVIHALKQDARTASIPVVVLSGLRPEEAPRNGNRAEVAGWVMKPLEESELFNTVSKVLRGLPGKTRVLIVDEDPELMRVLQYMMYRDGIEVELAHTADDAIRAVPEFRPDLIVLDPALRPGDGSRVSQWLRASKQFQEVPIVIYSAREFTPAERERMNLDSSEFFNKQLVAPDDFEQRILTLVTQMIPAKSAGVAQGKANV